ncbi:MAG: hypothetical protein ABSC77_02230 [Terracidiphilus sp.]|jgi:hypothetical protein
MSLSVSGNFHSYTPAMLIREEMSLIEAEALAGEVQRWSMGQTVRLLKHHRLGVPAVKLLRMAGIRELLFLRHLGHDSPSRPALELTAKK